MRGTPLLGKALPRRSVHLCSSPRVNEVPNSTRWHLFIPYLNNVEIELNFETKNEVAG